MTPSRLVRNAGLVALASLAVSCGRPMIAARPTAPQATPGVPVGELWNEPTDLAGRDLMWGAARPDQAPGKDAYTVQKQDVTGYSRGYDVTGPDGRKWDIKVGKEAQTEVALSRILWALGYHQPATYYVTGWQLEGTWDFEGEPARFRLQSDHDADGEWDWLDNPFNASRPLNGLIAINLLLNNWDFKTSNNRVYRTTGSDGPPQRRYVVQDLGASLGKPKVFPIPVGTRNDVVDFEDKSLIKEVRGSRVWLNYRGKHRDVLEQLDVADVVWACELMNRLSDAQLDDAFEAAGYEPEIRSRFIAKIRAKIQEGLALQSTIVASSREQE